MNYKDPRPIYEQVKHGLRQMMLTGEIPAGGRLPSVRELAVQLAINPNTIQRAYRELEQEGSICSVPGKGSFAQDDETQHQVARMELFSQLEEVVEKLKETGLSTEEICARIQDGGVSR